jgi:hypothetical protein
VKTGAFPGWKARPFQSAQDIPSFHPEATSVHYMPKQSKPHPYRNIFTMNRLGKMPLVLRDGTSVEFPSNWTKEEADIWREHANLSVPKKG